MRDTVRDDRAPARWKIAVAAILAAALLAIGIWFVTQGPGARIISPEGSSVAQFTGTGDLASQSFTVRDGWRMRWSTSGERLSVAIRGDRNLGTVVDVEGPDTGTSVPPVGGTYHLEIAAEGPWTVTILQGE